MKNLLKLLILTVPVTLFLTLTACSGDNTGSGGGTTEDYPYYSQFNIPSAEDNLGDALAFPGAEGGGMYVTGGRGGQVIHVTNLDDNGTGSFRAAATTSGARIVVFDVAGTIHLESELRIRSNDMTVLGQTAPGNGICIGGNTVHLDADNIIFRYIRFRCSDIGSLSGEDADSADAIWGRYHQNIIFDHCTMSWSIDECASFYGNQNFTMQWCIISEALNNSLHSKEAHGYGGIWGGKNASFHHNLLAHNNSRNARIDHPGVYNSTTYLEDYRGNVDLRNNVVYNWGSNSAYGGEDGWFNFVNNYYKVGPGSTDRGWFLEAYFYSSNTAYNYPELYMSGNEYIGGNGINSSYPNGVCYATQSGVTAPNYVQNTSPFSIRYNDATTCYTTTHSAANAFTKVTDYAGPSLSRDAVDTRVCNEAKNGTATYTGSKTNKAGIIDTLSDIEGDFPELTGTADTDTDGDGMPDWFEDQFGLDANNASDATTKTLDKYGRYTNLEMYAHYLVKDIVSGQNSSGTYTALD